MKTTIPLLAKFKLACYRGKLFLGLILGSERLESLPIVGISPITVKLFTIKYQYH